MSEQALVALALATASSLAIAITISTRPPLVTKSPAEDRAVPLWNTMCSCNLPTASRPETNSSYVSQFNFPEVCHIFQIIKLLI